MSDILRGNHVMGSTRAPKVIDGVRMCAADGCTTRLSRYNKRTFCYVHAPTRYPRLRGRIATES